MAAVESVFLADWSIPKGAGRFDICSAGVDYFITLPPPATFRMAVMCELSVPYQDRGTQQHLIIALTDADAQLVSPRFEIDVEVAGADQLVEGEDIRRMFSLTLPTVSVRKSGMYTAVAHVGDSAPKSAQFQVTVMGKAAVVETK